MRQVVQIHSIAQWMSLAKEVQEMLLRTIKIRDRLWAFRLAKEQTKVDKTIEPGWKPCHRCDQRGFVYIEGRKAGIHPSALGTSCTLKIYYEAMGVQQQVQHEARELLVFDLGTAAHDMFQSFGAQGAWGQHYRSEVSIGDTPIAKELMIEGHADAENILVIDEIAEAPIFELGLVHEYKTINDNGFSDLKGRPKPAHIQQATVYSACLDRPIVVYMYLNKNNSNIADFSVPFNPSLWQQIANRAATVRDAVRNQTPPPADVGYHCKQCGYVYQCPAYAAAKSQKG